MSADQTEQDVTPIVADLPSAAAQAEAATTRIRERTAQRLERADQLNRPHGLGHADSLERVALRVDRLSRTVAGEAVPSTPADEPADAPEAVIAAAVARSAERLGVADAVAAVDSAQDAAGVVLEAIIGPANFLEVRYLGVGAIAARAVGRVSIRDAAGDVIGFGTGSLVSPRLLLTNHHVLEDAGVARLATIEFDFEDGLDDRPLRPVTFPLDPETFFVNDAELDFALVAVGAEESELRRFGFNRLLDVGGRWSTGDSVSIVQHPRGRAKEVALRDNRVVDNVSAFLHYATDTEPGSSGSPVFNNAWELVALHHASVRAKTEFGEIINEGIRIGPIVAFARDHVTPEQQPLLAGLTLGESARVESPADTPAPDRDDGEPSPSISAVTSVSAPARAGDATTVRVSIPLELTVSIGSPTVAGAAPAAVPTAAAGEAITIDPDYTHRGGYDPGFLGTGDLHVPLPTLPAELLEKTARPADATGPDAHVLPYHHFSVVMNRERHLAFFTAVNIDGQSSMRLKRERDRWTVDPRLQPSEQTGEAVYARNPLDRGHLVRRLDPAWGANAEEAKRANDDTFHFTNCSPQHERFNQNSTTWAGLEDYILDNADNRDFRATVFTGPVFADDDDEYRGIRLPRQFWKVAVMVRSDGRLSATAYLLSQAVLIDGLESTEEFNYGAYRTFQVPVDQIEALTRLTFAGLATVDPLRGFETTDPRAREVERAADLVL